MRVWNGRNRRVRMGFLRQTSETFGSAKSRIAESTGSESQSATLTKAGKSLQAAFRYWNSVANWKWLRQTTTFDSVAGTSAYALPSLLRSVHSILVTSSQHRALEYMDRRFFNKVLPNHSRQDLPQLYDLFGSESSTGQVILWPTPSGTETFELDYYRRMVIPCTVSGTFTCTTTPTDTIVASFIQTAPTGATIGSLIIDSDAGAFPTGTVIKSIGADGSIVTDQQFTGSVLGTYTLTIGGDAKLLDCPEDYVEGIIAWATHHYLINKAGAPRLDYWREYAEQELAKAIKANATDAADQELRFLPADMYSTNPLGPNDIRWADVGW